MFDCYYLLISNIIISGFIFSELFVIVGIRNRCFILVVFIIGNKLVSIIGVVIIRGNGLLFLYFFLIIFFCDCNGGVDG